MVVWFYGDLVQIRALDLIMERLPTLKVVLNHSAFMPDIHAEMQVDEHRRPHFDVELPPSGLPAVEAMAAAHPNLHVHFSGAAVSGEPYPSRRSRGTRRWDLTRHSVRTRSGVGVRLAVDQEFEPGYAEMLGVVDHLLPNLTSDERDAIRGGTALSLFRF